MTTIELTSEFDYFTVERGKILEHLVRDGFAVDVTERVRRTIQHIAESLADDHEHKHGIFLWSGWWTDAVRAYTKALGRPGEFGLIYGEGTLQFDSLAEEDYGWFSIINLHQKNADRGEAFNNKYLVLIHEGVDVGNVTLAFTCEDEETAWNVVQPQDADLACENPDCQGYLRMSEGAYMRTEQEYRYEPERGEYDAEGIYCPFCTSYTTGYPREIGGVWFTNNEGDAAFLPHQDAVEGEVMEPYRLRATMNLD